MENKNKVLIAGVIAMVLVIGLIISKSQSNEPVVLEKQKIELSDKSDSHQAFVRHNHGPVKNQQQAAKKLVQSKIAKFQRRAKSNTTTLTPTRAHEFHNPKAASLNGAKKAKAVEVKGKKKKPVTEEDKKKAAELAKNQAFMEEQCGDIKDNEEKAECHQAVAFYLNQQKKKQAKAKADKDNKKKEALAENKKEVPTQSEETKSDYKDESVEPGQTVVTNNVVNNGNKPETAEPAGDSSEDNKPKTLTEWKEFMIVTDEEGGDLFSKAPILLAATKKSGKESLALNDFYILIREYYLKSENTELEVLGIQTLNGVQSLLSFRNAIGFFSQENIASGPEQIATIDANILETYQQDSQLSNLNIFLNTFALPAVIGEDGDDTTTPWDKKDPLFLTIQYIKGFSEVRLASLTNTTEGDDHTDSLKLVNPLTSIQSDLKTLIEDTETVDVVRADAASAQGAVTLLIEKLDSLKPTEPTTQTPTTLTNFTPR